MASDETNGVDAPAGKAVRGVMRVFDLLCGLMFAAIFLVFCYKILRRYTVGDAVAWGDELTVILFIWVVFIANGFVVDDRRQIAFDLVIRNVHGRARPALELLRTLLIGGLFAAALPQSVDYILFLWRERTPVLQWRLDYVYACFGLFMMAIVLRHAWHCVRLVRVLLRGASA